MKRPTGFLLSCFLSVGLLVSPDEGHADADGQVLVSGPMSVQLTYDEAATEGGAEAAPGDSGSDVSCSGGSLVAAMDCVAERIGGTGGSGGQTRERGAENPAPEGQPAISVTMTGTVTPVVVDQGNGSFLLQVKDAISMPQFSPGTPAAIKSRAGRDEAQIKFGLRKWSQIVTVEALRAEPEQEMDFSGPFSGLSLFTVRSPQPQTFRVYWRSGQCDELEDAFRQAQTDYISHVSAMPVLDQIDLVTGTMSEIEEALKLTADGTSGVADQIAEVTELKSVNEKLDQLMEEAGGLSNALTGALEDVKKRLSEEHERLMKSTGVGEPLGQIKAGLEKNAETMKKVASAINEMNSKAQDLGRLFEAADGSASDQLKVFQQYFGAVHEKLGPLVDAIPGLGVFLDLYGQAIGQIAESAERIEKAVDERNRQAREAGIPEPYVKARTARERAEAERVRLENLMNELADRVAQECPGFDLSGQYYSEIQAIEDAKYRAGEACADKRMNISDAARIREEFRAASRGYSDGRLADTEKRYVDLRASFRELQSLQNKLENNRVRSRDERAMVINALKAYYTDQRRISEYEASRDRYFAGHYNSRDITALRAYLEDRKSAMRQVLAERDEARRDKIRYDAAKSANDALNSNNAEYRRCVDRYIRGLAAENGWSPRLVEVLTNDY